MRKTYVGIRILSFSLLLFVHLVPSSFAAETASRDSIREIQTILALKGLYDGRVDGVNGPKTERAILRYEQQLGWSQTGQINERLTERLHAEAESALKGVVPRNDSQNTPEADSAINKKVESLAHDLNHAALRISELDPSLKPFIGEDER